MRVLGIAVASTASSPVRRHVIHALAAGALLAALNTVAQSSKVWRLGFLSARRRPSSLDADYYGALPRRLNELGYFEGRNLLIEWRFADGDYQRLPDLAAQLARLDLDVILALGPPATLAAQLATVTIPIVFVVSADPVALGIVKSLARPGGNTTGIFNLGIDLSSKHVELLLAIAPEVSRVALLVNPGNSAHGAMLKGVESAMQTSRVELIPIEVQSTDDIRSAFSRMARQKVGAVIVPLDPFFIQEARVLGAEATRHHLPSAFAFREAAEFGGLMSYGQNQVQIYRRAAEYVDRILKGARPGDLPVEQPAMLELVINGRTARALGRVIPASLRMRADKILD